jgi:colanic acid biosynthesis glycosyl transferase WcaI
VTRWYAVEWSRSTRGRPRQSRCDSIGVASDSLTKRSRPHLLVLNQYYSPGVEATAGLLTEICEELATTYDVTVVTGRVRGHEGQADYEQRNGVEVIRVHSTSFDRARLLHRAVNYFTYVFRALRRGLVGRRPDLVLSMTDPPMIGTVAYLVARRFRVPFVVVAEDVFPEIAVALDRLRNPAIIVPLRVLTRHYFKRADRVVAIGETMKRRLVEKGVSAARVTVIPNWVDTSAITPQARDNEWAREHGLTDRFVVMHSGNIGHAQDLETLIRAGALLKDDPAISIVLVGFGARHQDYVRLSRSCGASNVRFLPHQPREVLPLSLSSCDVHFVGLGAGLAGYVVPSRLAGIMAAGRPVLAAADEESETAHAVRAAGCGRVIAPGDPVSLAMAISEFSQASDLDELGRKARLFAVEHLDRRAAIAQYRALVAEVLSQAS